MIRSVYPIILALLVGGCAAGPSKVQQQERSTPPVAVEIEFEAPAGWTEVQRHHFDEAGLGIRLRLKLDEWPWVRMDLFAYQVGVTDDLAIGLRDVVNTHRAELDYAVENGRYTGWTLLAESDFEVADHPVLTQGKRLSLRLQLDGDEQGSTSYLFYRPPFALKVRASYPGFADVRTEEGVDAAVRELIPAVEVTAPALCKDRKIHVRLPDSTGLNEEEETRLGVIAFAGAMLEHALHGCMDLAGALALADLACTDYQTLCGNPPWSMGDGE